MLALQIPVFKIYCVGYMDIRFMGIVDVMIDFSSSCDWADTKWFISPDTNGENFVLSRVYLKKLNNIILPTGESAKVNV